MLAICIDKCILHRMIIIVMEVIAIDLHALLSIIIITHGDLFE